MKVQKCTKGQGQRHSGGAAHPLRSDPVAAPNHLRLSPAVDLWPPALQGLFLLLTHTLSLIVRPYADSSELSYSYCMDFCTLLDFHTLLS